MKRDRGKEQAATADKTGERGRSLQWMGRGSALSSYSSIFSYWQWRWNKNQSVLLWERRKNLSRRSPPFLSPSLLFYSIFSFWLKSIFTLSFAFYLCPSLLWIRRNKKSWKKKSVASQINILEIWVWLCFCSDTLTKVSKLSKCWLFPNLFNCSF